MTDYYFYNGLSFPSPSVDSSSQCTVPADPTHGSYSDYSAGERTCTAGETIYSGNACIPSCDDGYEVSGMTRCVGGSITETATCVLATPAPTYTPTTSSTSCYPFPTSNPTSNLNVILKQSEGNLACSMAGRVLLIHLSPSHPFLF